MSQPTDHEATTGVVKTTESARQGVTGHNARYVLVLSTLGTMIVFAVLLAIFVT